MFAVLLTGLFVVGCDRCVHSAFRAHVHCIRRYTGRFRAHYGWSNPFAVRSVQKDQIGP